MHGNTDFKGLFDDVVNALKAVAAIAGSIYGIISFIGHIRKQWKRYVRPWPVYLRKEDRATTSLPWRRTAFLFLEETVIIVSCGILLNVVCLTISSQFSSILFLDMLGTAVVALLLGPWYGAATGLISNMINSLLISGPALVPWAVVNMIGGLFWGHLARTDLFRRFMSENNPRAGDWGAVLFLFGVLGAVVMAFPGPFIQQAIGQTTLAVDPAYPDALEKVLGAFVPSLKNVFLPIFPSRTADALANIVLGWIQRTIIFIPDKIFSVVGAVIVIRTAFPLFSKFLIRSGIYTDRSEQGYLDPIALLITLLAYYIAVFIVIVGSKIVVPQYSWILLILPALTWAIGAAVSCLPDKSEEINIVGKDKRRKCYLLAVKCLPEDSASRPGPSFLLGYLALSFGLVLIIPVFSGSDDFENYLGIVFNLLCVICGFQCTIYIYGVSICQNFVVRNLESKLFFQRVATLSDDREPETREVAKVLAPTPA